MTPGKTQAGTHRILIVDDHPVLRQGVRQVIDNEVDLEVCGECQNAEEAMLAVESARPDIVLVDLSLGGLSGLDLIRNLQTEYPELATLVLSVHDEGRYAERSIRAGAKGYVMKDQDIGVVVEAIRKVLQGDIYLSQRMMPQLLSRLFESQGEKSMRPDEVLSNRELQVFEMIGKGQKTSKIAETLHLSPKTIQVYRENIKRKLNLEDAVHLHQAAFEWAQGEALK